MAYKWDNKKPTAQMLGRWQPFHDGHYVIADFIAPTPEARSLFPADFRVWVDTIKEGRFEDTNQMFVNPKNFDFHVTTQDAKNWAPKIIEEIKK